MSDKKVLFLAGPGGAGKTTVANILEKKYGFIFVNGDSLDTEFFPKGGQWLPDNLDKLRKAHDKILREVKDRFDNGKNNVVLDYIVFGDYLEFFRKFKKEFGDDLNIKVLFPDKEEIIKRDIERECWTTGVEKIEVVCKEFERIKGEIGEENYINTTNQTPEKTVEEVLKIDN